MIDKPTGKAAIWLKAAALAPAFLVGVPAQWLAVKTGSRLQCRLPMLFHRYAAFVLGVRRTIENAASGDRPLLILSNHMSWLDIIVLGSLMPLSFIAKSEVGTWPLFGLLAKLQRSVFVDRTRRAATADVNESVAARLNAGDVMVLFAEGTTSDGSRVLPFRSALLGAARAAIDSGAKAGAVTVQPLAIAYTRRHGLPLGRAGRPFIAWYGDMDLIPHLGSILTGGPIDVTITFGAPIAFGAGDDRKQVAAKAERSVRAGVSRANTGRGNPVSDVVLSHQTDSI